MEYQEAIASLEGLLDTHRLKAEENEAVVTTTGVLALGVLGLE